MLLNILLYYHEFLIASSTRKVTPKSKRALIRKEKHPTRNNTYVCVSLCVCLSVKRKIKSMNHVKFKKCFPSCNKNADLY